MMATDFIQSYTQNQMERGLLSKTGGTLSRALTAGPRAILCKIGTG